MQKSRNDVWVGLFVVIGAAALLFLALKAGNLLSLSFDPTYRVTARFDNIGGLKTGAAVKSAGVVVGRVKAIGFDDKMYQASVELEMQQRYAFPKDSSLKILTAGLLGEQYLGIEPGASEQNLAGRRHDHADAVGGGAGDADQPVPLQQGRRRQRRAGRSERHAAWRAALCSADGRSAAGPAAPPPSAPIRSSRSTARSSPSTRRSTRRCSSRLPKAYRDGRCPRRCRPR